MSPSNNSSNLTHQRLGFSLVEMLVVIAVVGITTMIAIPMISTVVAAGEKTIARRNAQSTVSVSTKLSSIGVAHVLPESLGGAEATTRLLRRGVRVPDGPLQGQYFGIDAMSDEDIASAAIFMEILFNDDVLQLGYNPTADYSP